MAYIQLLLFFENSPHIILFRGTVFFPEEYIDCLFMSTASRLTIHRFQVASARLVLPIQNGTDSLDLLKV
jgi:hypothetical protein